MISRVLLALCLLLLGCSRGMAQEVQSILPPFQSVLPQLQQQTQIPVLLPNQIPGHTGAFFAAILTAETDSYDVSLDNSADCHGAGYCNFGLLSAQRLYQDTPSVQEDYAYQSEPDFRPVVRSPEIQGTVELARGIQGYFVPYVCGANCDTSKVFWEQDGVRYMVGIRAEDRAVVVALANAIINNQP